MKNLAKILTVFFLMIVLSGCSLNLKGAAKIKTTGSIWKSIDGGKTWIVKNKTKDNLNTAIADADILTLAINPFDSGNVLFGTRSNGIIKTVDGGETLEATNFISEKVYGLVFSPVDGRTIYASGVWQKRGKIWKSIDGGENWNEIFTAASEGPLVISMLIDKKNPNILFASTSDNQVLKSVDDGQSWKNIFQATAPVLQVVLDNINSNLVYFNVSGNGIYRSKDGGNTSENISKKVSVIPGVSISEIQNIKTDPNNSNWIYILGKSGMLRSKNAGENWEKMMVLDDPKKFPVTTLAIGPVNSREMIYGAAKTVYGSEDQGVNWTPFQISDPKTIKIIKYSSMDPQIIYLGTSK